MKGSALLVLLGLAGCEDVQKANAPVVAAVEGPTFYQDILPLVGENCQQCHNSTLPMGAAFPLETYEQIAAFAPVLLSKMNPVGDTTDPFFMPPFNAKDGAECSPPHAFRGTYAVEQSEYDLFAEWIDNGKAKGDPSTLEPFTVPPMVDLEGSITALEFAADYNVPPPAEAGYDTFRCFALQTEDGLVAPPVDLWIDGFQFRPGNPLIAHHMLVFSVPDLNEHLAAGLVEDPETNSWACDGAVSRADGSYIVRDFSLVWGWVPGGLPLDLQWNMGMRLRANTGLVIQMHYNTLAEPDDLVDRSQLEMRVRDTPPEREAIFTLVGVFNSFGTDEVDDPPFEIPLGASEHVESYTEPHQRGDMRLWGFGAHMHYAGTSLDLRLLNDDAETCLLNVPRYDYNWQQMYTYEADWEDLPKIRNGDSLRVKCTYDNTEDNVMLQKYLGGPVVGGMRLGDGTSDEMCIVGLGLACDGMCEETDAPPSPGP